MDFIQNNILLIAVAVVSGAMLLWPMLRRNSGGSSVNTLQATQLINREDALVLDVREAIEYVAGHVPGAKNVPLGQLETRVAEIQKYKAKPVIVVCASGSRASGAIAILNKLNFANVHKLSGGFPTWQQAGLPVEK